MVLIFEIILPPFFLEKQKTKKIAKYNFGKDKEKRKIKFSLGKTKPAFFILTASKFSKTRILP